MAYSNTAAAMNGGERSFQTAATWSGSGVSRRSLAASMGGNQLTPDGASTRLGAESGSAQRTEMRQLQTLGSVREADI